MSREVRRVPVDYKHPTQYNLYWENHYAWFKSKMGRDYRLHGKTERFIALHQNALYHDILHERHRQLKSYQEKKGHDWDFSLQYHLTGHSLNEEEEPTVHPVVMYDDFDDEILVDIHDENHLQEILIQKIEEEIESEHLVEDDFMPSFEDIPEDQLGYCLYETVSEGTPVTPVFATPEELIDYLVKYGTENDPPFRCESAKALVNTGFSVGSAFVIGGKFYHGAQDMDKLDTA